MVYVSLSLIKYILLYTRDLLAWHMVYTFCVIMQLQKAAKLLDSAAVRATRFLWQYPVARVLLLFYMVRMVSLLFKMCLCWSYLWGESSYRHKYSLFLEFYFSCMDVAYFWFVSFYLSFTSATRCWRSENIVSWCFWIACICRYLCTFSWCICCIAFRYGSLAILRVPAII